MKSGANGWALGWGGVGWERERRPFEVMFFGLPVCRSCRLKCVENGEESSEKEIVFSMKCHITSEVNQVDQGIKGVSAELCYSFYSICTYVYVCMYLCWVKSTSVYIHSYKCCWSSMHPSYLWTCPHLQPCHMPHACISLTISRANSVR